MSVFHGFFGIFRAVYTGELGKAKAEKGRDGE